MLFDLRSKGRRRTMQVVYIGLAILLASGLVLFGIGTGTGGGGLLGGLSGSGSSNNQSGAVGIHREIPHVAGDEIFIGCALRDRKPVQQDQGRRRRCSSIVQRDLRTCMGGIKRRVAQSECRECVAERLRKIGDLETSPFERL